MSLADHAMRRLEGETFVQAELLRRCGQLMDDEVKALASGMIMGVLDLLQARFGARPNDLIVDLPICGLGLRVVGVQDDAPAGPI